ncbi:Serpin-ZX [Striga hermonthica]|uniref:Serpin-ZX n=1 Tax=Striga hermonthica TaxID=68872 RepID=A0A9N7NBS4_STRHE|nr:Serpin-ZX [Striga hermonthica]
MDILHAITKQTDFSLKLAEQFMSTDENKNRNFVFSPLLVHIGLSMTTFGSGGPTQDQLLGFLGSKSINEIELLLSQLFTPMLDDREALGGPRLSLANGVWVDRSLTLKPTFEKFVVESCKATLKSVDFQSEADEVAKRVNAWAEEKTNGLIKQVLPPDSANNLTRLILANALYFKGTWNNYFHKKLTSDREFFLLNGISVRAPFMTTSGSQYFRAFDGFKVLRLPYKNGRDSEHRKIFHPKVQNKFGFEASKVLKGKGLVRPFSSGGLTEMVRESGPGKELFVAGMFQRSCVEVDEHGTEAASAFAVMCGGGPGPYEPMNFVADHPFMFVVREDVSGVVLFVGQVLNPLSTD